MRLLLLLLLLIAPNAQASGGLIFSVQEIMQVLKLKRISASRLSFVVFRGEPVSQHALIGVVPGGVAGNDLFVLLRRTGIAEGGYHLEINLLSAQKIGVARELESQAISLTKRLMDEELVYYVDSAEIVGRERLLPRGDMSSAIHLVGLRPHPAGGLTNLRYAPQSSLVDGAAVGFSLHFLITPRATEDHLERLLHSILHQHEFAF